MSDQVDWVQRGKDMAGEIVGVVSFLGALWFGTRKPKEVDKPARDHRVDDLVRELRELKQNMDDAIEMIQNNSTNQKILFRRIGENESEVREVKRTVDLMLEDMRAFYERWKRPASVI